MHYTVCDFVGSISPEQREVLDRVLEPGERIFWATRPRVSAWPERLPSGAVDMVFLLLLLGFFFVASIIVLLDVLPQLMFEEHEWYRACALLVGLVLGLLVLGVSGRYVVRFLSWLGANRRRRRHTLYIITDRRALTLEPGLEGWKTDGFSLDADMVLLCADSRAGGELIFRIDCAQRVASGWHALVDRNEAEAQLYAALAARERQRRE